MNLSEFLLHIKAIQNDEELVDFCHKYVLHGIPFVFKDGEDDYYEFRKLISKKFKIPFHEVYITGSAKLGFSPYKLKLFDYDSDIDVALISPSLFEHIMQDITNYQWQFKRNRAVVRENELEMYHEFLEYVALGWIRPDKLPISFQMKTIKKDWFDFFESISYGKSIVGNYEVNAGVFKSYGHLERYIVNGLQQIRRQKNVRTAK